MSEPGPILNIDEVHLERQFHGATFDVNVGAIGLRIGAKRLGYRLCKVPPGKRAWPYHSHYANEEMFFILAGTGTLRQGDKTYPIRAGDIIAAPPGGAETAHQIVNDGTGELSYLAVSTMLEPEVVEYPDSGKFGVRAVALPGGDASNRSFAFFGRRASEVDYWDGED